ncbi:unnamed protein product [Paramecium sonneborni]|uniref:Uncharacterized protein n=1 Tax=Paramecium sonneborni TaxID=65129 RepID=A0A8S1JX32_9CILI|nr:unnamed protein product [Paramecium sonneborni]
MLNNQLKIQRFNYLKFEHQHKKVQTLIRYRYQNYLQQKVVVRNYGFQKITTASKKKFLLLIDMNIFFSNY